MFSTNTQQKVLSYQSKTNNNRSSPQLFTEENNIIFTNNKVEKAVNIHQHRSPKVKLKSETILLTASAIHMDNSIVKPSNMMFSSVYRICIVCFLETLKLIKGTLKQIDGREKNIESSDRTNSDGTLSPNSLKRERTIRKKKYSTSSNNVSSTSNVCYVRTKVGPGLIRQRANKINQERLCASKSDTYTKYERDINVDLPKRIRSLTFPGDRGKTTTIKVLSATKTPQKCCLKKPSQNYTALVSTLNGETKSFDQFLIQASKNLGRGYRKRFSIPSTNIGSSRNSSVYRRRSLEVVLEEEE
jgi:hypothetical protein